MAPLAEFSENDIRDLFEILRYVQRDPRRLAGVLRLLRESGEITAPICEEGWHKSESLGGTRRRCSERVNAQERSAATTRRSNAQ